MSDRTLADLKAMQALPLTAKMEPRDIVLMTFLICAGTAYPCADFIIAPCAELK